MRLEERLLVLLSHTVDRGEVDLDRLEHVRDRTPVFRQPLPGPLPYRVQRDDVAVVNRVRRASEAERRSGRRRGRTCLDRRAHRAPRRSSFRRVARLRGREPDDVEPVLRDQPARDAV